MMAWDTQRPSPVPSPAGFVVENASKIRRSRFGGMPGPVSSTSSRTWFAAASTRRRVSTRGPACVAFDEVGLGHLEVLELAPGVRMELRIGEGEADLIRARFDERNLGLREWLG